MCQCFWAILYSTELLLLLLLICLCDCSTSPSCSSSSSHTSFFDTRRACTTPRRRSRPDVVFAADRTSPLNGSRSACSPGPATVLLPPARPGPAAGDVPAARRSVGRSSVSQFSDGRNRPRIIEHKSATTARPRAAARRPPATSRPRRPTHVGDDLTLQRHRRGLKSEILASRRAGCESPIGIKHRLAFSYALPAGPARSSSSSGEAVWIWAGWLCDLFLAHVRVAGESQ